MIARRNITSPSNNASTDTFGAKPTQRPVSPVPARYLEAETRPPLQRATTPDPVQQQAVKTIFTTGAFSDPPKVKSWKYGVEVLSEGHKRLVILLREEACRLYSYNSDLRSRLANAQREARSAQNTSENLRAQVRGLVKNYDQLSRELEAARASLSDMDAMVDNVRSNRLSRLAHLSDDQTAELRALGES